MTKAELVLNIVEIICLFIPVGGLIWKAATQAAKIKELDVRVTAKTNEMQDSMHELRRRIDKVEEDNSRDIAEIKTTLNQMAVSTAEIKTSLKYITEKINEQAKKSN